MEAKVHEELLSFLAQHNLEDTVSNIDDIVLSYLVGVVELVSQGDDGLDIVELMEMMNAYLPGFDEINRSEIMDWMFGLASRLIRSSGGGQEISCQKGVLSVDRQEQERPPEVGSKQDMEINEKRFPTYNYSDTPVGLNNFEDVCSSSAVAAVDNKITHSAIEKDIETSCCQNCGPIVFISSSPSKQLPCPFPSQPEPQNNPSRSKRKGRQLSCSSQDSQDDFSKTDSSTNEETLARTLLEMFPSACTMEARHCLQLSAGNMDRAAQLIMDRQDTEQAIKSQAKTRSASKSHKMKKLVDYKLDDDIIKSCVLQKKMDTNRRDYLGSQHTAESQERETEKLVKHVCKCEQTMVQEHLKSYLECEAKKLVRYREGQVVSMKGERYSEVKRNNDSDEMKASYVSLKPARKYRFH